MAVGALGIVLILFGWNALWASAFVRAFDRGLAAARDPMHRVTLVPAREHFRRVAWKRLRWWLPAWSLIMGSFVVAVFFSESRLIDRPLLYKCLNVASGLSIFGGQFALQLGLALWLTPRLRSVAGKVTLLSVTPVLFQVIALLGVGLGFPRSLRWVRFVTDSGVHEMHDVTPIWTVIPALALAGFLWWLCRRSGDRYFRFEE
jgi:hypothetical protein